MLLKTWCHSLNFLQVFISPEAQFLLLLYLMVRLKKLLSLLISVGTVNTYFIRGNCIKFSQASLKSKHAREKQKQKIKQNRSIAVVKFIEAIQCVFHQIFLKQKKKIWVGWVLSGLSSRIVRDLQNAHLNQQPSEI